MQYHSTYSSQYTPLFHRWGYSTKIPLPSTNPPYKIQVLPTPIPITVPATKPPSGHYLLSTNPQHQTSYPVHFLSSKSPPHQSLTNPASHTYCSPSIRPDATKGSARKPERKANRVGQTTQENAICRVPFLVVLTAQAYRAQEVTNRITKSASANRRYDFRAIRDMVKLQATPLQPRTAFPCPSPPAHSSISCGTVKRTTSWLGGGHHASAPPLPRSDFPSSSGFTLMRTTCTIALFCLSLPVGLHTIVRPSTSVPPAPYTEREPAAFPSHFSSFSLWRILGWMTSEGWRGHFSFFIPPLSCATFSRDNKSNPPFAPPSFPPFFPVPILLTDTAVPYHTPYQPTGSLISLPAHHSMVR